MFNEKELRAQMVRRGVSVPELCADLDIDESTFYRKLKADGAFTRKEINIIIDRLEIKDPMMIFFAPELA